MQALVKFESWLISRIKIFGGGYLTTAVTTYADYRYRHLNEPAATISFYAIFSVFPLLAFSAYMVGEITGKGDSQSAQMVVKILTDFVPGMQGWIQDGFFSLVKGKAATNWINAALLGWAGLGFFHAANSAIGKVPDHHHAPTHKSYVENTFFAAVTLALFTCLIAGVIYTEFLSSSKVPPLWAIPTENPMIQNFILGFVKSGALLGVTAVLTVGCLYFMLIPYSLKLGHALLGGALFSGLLVSSRAGYWIYMHYNEGAIQNLYGIFSAFMLMMLWVHFVSNCFVFSCLFAYHMGKTAEGKSQTAASHVKHAA